MIRKLAQASLFAALIASSSAGIASAHTTYDGRWSLSITTVSGACDPSYTFPVEISNGAVSFPGLVKAKGRVSAKGGVQVSVSVPGKWASGSGRLTAGSGNGRWVGKAGEERCSGTWTAQRA
jgi:hypothetical protein